MRRDDALCDGTVHFAWNALMLQLVDTLAHLLQLFITQESGRDRPRRGKNVTYEGLDPKSDNESVDDAFSDEKELDDESEEGIFDDEDEPKTKRRRSSNDSDVKGDGLSSNNRTSSRSNKYVANMAEPSTNIKDLLGGASQYEKVSKRKENRSSLEILELDSDDDSSIQPSSPKKRTAGRTKVQNSLDPTARKSPARRHAKARKSLAGSSPSQLSDSNESVLESADEMDDQEPLKVQRIIASRSETRGKWREICASMQTSEVTSGSRWFQPVSSDDADADKDFFEERFLCKWKDLSYLHCSWETQDDLTTQVEFLALIMRTFFRKSKNGLLFTADERCDGDYFDPAWTQVDRILEVHMPEENGAKYPQLTAEMESTYTGKDFGVVTDRSDAKFDEGTGRQFLIKWSNEAYSECTYEFERDLILMEVDYKEKVTDFLRRTRKPTKRTMRDRAKETEEERRRLYRIFGEMSPISAEKKESAVDEYKQNLQERVYKNGGQLRDYQAEGIAWMVSNYVNGRSCILADEMGLG
jgi:hypothetical protein